MWRAGTERLAPGLRCWRLKCLHTIKFASKQDALSIKQGLRIRNLAFLRTTAGHLLMIWPDGTIRKNNNFARFLRPPGRDFRFGLREQDQVRSFHAAGPGATAATTGTHPGPAAADIENKFGGRRSAIPETRCQSRQKGGRQNGAAAVPQTGCAGRPANRGACRRSLCGPSFCHRCPHGRTHCCRRFHERSSGCRCPGHQSTRDCRRLQRSSGCRCAGG